MTDSIKDAQTRLAALETIILARLIEFEQDTGICVEGLSYHVDRVRTSGGESRATFRRVDIETRLQPVV